MNLFYDFEPENMPRRTICSKYRVQYGQPLGKDGVSVVLFVIFCAISATTIIIYLLQKYDQKGSGSFS
jgi:hypothetical protein